MNSRWARAVSSRQDVVALRAGIFALRGHRATDLRRAYLYLTVGQFKRPIIRDARNSLRDPCSASSRMGKKACLSKQKTTKFIARRINHRLISEEAKQSGVRLRLIDAISALRLFSILFSRTRYCTRGHLGEACVASYEIPQSSSYLLFSPPTPPSSSARTSPPLFACTYCRHTHLQRFKNKLENAGSRLVIKISRAAAV